MRRRYMHKRGVRCHPVSVRPSVTFVYMYSIIHTAEDIVKLLSPPGCPITLGLYFDPGAPGGPKIHGNGKNLRFSTEIAYYLGYGTR